MQGLERGKTATLTAIGIRTSTQLPGPALPSLAGQRLFTTLDYNLTS
jgi:hypothetical protein